MPRQRIYLDYAASTPVDPAVARAMRPYGSRIFGNPGAVHWMGQEAVAAVDRAREDCAVLLGRPVSTGFREIIFTGSATEANNLALRGVVKAATKVRSGYESTKPRIVVSAIEHESVLETARDLEREGVEVVVVPVRRDGVVEMKALKAAVDARTVLVSIMYANNEVGSIQPIQKIAALLRSVRVKGEVYPVFHTDAAQAFQFFECRPAELGVDCMTLSAHKIYGPKGIGMLFVRHGLWSADEGKTSVFSRGRSWLAPMITGGGQEFGLRSGTENVPAIVGFATALRLAAERRTQEGKRMLALRSAFWGKLGKAYPGAALNGPPLSSRLANNLNVYFPRHSAEEFIMRLDRAGIAVSSGAACAARSRMPSHVVTALGYSTERATRSIRFSFGALTKAAELDEAMRQIKMIVAK